MVHLYTGVTFRLVPKIEVWQLNALMRQTSVRYSAVRVGTLVLLVVLVVVLVADGETAAPKIEGVVAGHDGFVRRREEAGLTLGAVQADVVVGEEGVHADVGGVGTAGSDARHDDDGLKRGASSVAGEVRHVWVGGWGGLLGCRLVRKTARNAPFY